MDTQEKIDFLYELAEKKFQEAEEREYQTKIALEKAEAKLSDANEAYKKIDNGFDSLREAMSRFEETVDCLDTQIDKIYKYGTSINPQSNADYSKLLNMIADLTNYTMMIHYAIWDRVGCDI